MTSRRVAYLASVLLLAGTLAGCRDQGQGAAGARPADAGLPTAAEALAELEQLPVRGRGPRTGYSRAQYGKAWADVDRNGCDTRSDVLNRDLTAVTHKPGTRGCVVLRGTLADPYTGTSLVYERGGVDEVSVDHVVALSDAWQKGAATWGVARRAEFANDPLNLLAVTTTSNKEKGDADAASWLPPAKGYRCAYVARQVAVKVAYQLAVTAAERETSRRILDDCAGRRWPARSAAGGWLQVPGWHPRLHENNGVAVEYGVGDQTKPPSPTLLPPQSEKPRPLPRVTGQIPHPAVPPTLPGGRA